MGSKISGRSAGFLIPVHSVLLALSALSTCVLAWGPLSHATFNCRALYRGQDVASCLASRGSFVVGSDFPDAFGFGDMNITDLPGQKCKGLIYIHDPIYGGFQLQRAVKQNNTGDPRMVEFSKGFVSHVVGDLVGFFPSSAASGHAGGILCSSRAIAAGQTCSRGGLLWMPEWGFMSALDAFFYAQDNVTSAGDLPLPDNETMGPAVYQFVSESTAAYNKVLPTFKPVLPDVVEACATFWAGNMKYVFQRAQLYSQQQEFMQAELSFFATSPGKLSWGALRTYIEQQATCASKAVAFHIEQLVDKTPQAAWQATSQFVTQLYQQGACSPPLSAQL